MKIKVTVTLETQAPVELEVGNPETTIDLWSCFMVDEKEFSDQDVATRMYQSLRAKLKGDEPNGI